MVRKHKIDNLDKTQDEKKTAFVVLFSAVIMVLEIFFGLFTNSMALLADGIHMGSHVLAIGLSWGAYVLVRRLKRQHANNIDGDKILALSAYTSGILLLLFALFIMVEAIERLFAPNLEIRYIEAMVVAVIGLVVNIICASVLHDKSGDGDYNRRSAYLHVLADALTSIGAIFGLICAMIWNIIWIDSLVALICSIVIVRWAIGMLWNTGKALTAKTSPNSQKTQA